MRISGINIEHVNEKEEFLSGEVATFCGGRVRLVTKEELKSFEEKWGKSPKLEKGFYWATWIERN